MNYFRYKLIATTGKISSGIIKLPYEDVISTISHLERDGSLTIYVSKLGKFVSLILKLGSLGLRKRLKRPDQAELLSNLALMLRSGIPLTTALTEAAGSLDTPGIANNVKDMVAAIQGGMSFSEAAGKYPDIFPETIIHLVRIGEETGQLDDMLKDASEHIKNIHTIISDTKQALLYPTFVFAAMGGGIGFWFYYVVPKILELFKEMDVTLPAITRYLLAVSAIFQNYFIHMLLGLGIVIIGIPAARRGSKRFKKITDWLLFKLPISGAIISASNLAFITEYFSLLVGAGIDILQSINILEESVGNEIYRSKLREVRGSLKKGESIAESFAGAIIFPRFVTRMISIGEKSGTLSNQLARIAEEYRSKLSHLVATIGKMIEPVVLVVAGAIFAVIFMALLLPVYDMVSQVSGM